MAPSKKSKSVNKRFSYVSEAVSNKYGETAGRSKQKKRKLSDMLGPQWSKEELERFYESYRKYGKDWKKVAAVVRNRSVEMVEALYTMNKAYLSLPEGTASVVGLIAMMTDHYSVLGGSDSEQESNDGSGSTRKPQKRARGKLQDSDSKGLDSNFMDVLQSQPLESSFGCLSLLKKRRSGIKPHAVGKRTPRVPVSYDKEIREKHFSSSARQASKLKHDDDEDDVAHEIAIALTEASQRGGSPQLSQTPNQKAEGPEFSPPQNGERMRSESEMTSAKLRYSEMDEGGNELSLGSTGADSTDYDGVKSYRMHREGAGVVEVQQKVKKHYGKKTEVAESDTNNFDDIKEACSGTEEGQKLGARGRYEIEDTDAKISRSSSKGLRKRSKKALFGGDESSDFDALKTLADLSLMMPETATDTESSAMVKEEIIDTVDKEKPMENEPVAAIGVLTPKKSKLGKGFARKVCSTPDKKEGGHQSNTGSQKRRPKSSPLKISKIEVQADSHLTESQDFEDVSAVKKFVSKGKRSPYNGGPVKPGKSAKTPENMSSSSDHRKEENNSISTMAPSPSANQCSLPTKVRSKRKMKLSANICGEQPSMTIPSSHDRALRLKEILSNCLSLYQARRWCTFEWFYSAIDYPWFAKCEFEEYLNHVGLGHIPRLTRVEWGVIRSSLGRPRRFSEQFLKEEKQKLNQYRESVRKHYAELRAGTREGLPADLARPLSVGQRVVAVHPRTREVHDGSVLTVDYNRCRVQFDRPDLGVEFVMDIDCMPLISLENMPASIARHGLTSDKIAGTLNEFKVNGQVKEGRIEASEKLENSDGLVLFSPSAHPIGKLLNQTKVDLTCSNLQAKVGLGDAVNTQQSATSQPSVISQVQAKEADVQALYELTRALEKKEAVVSELRRMNDEVMENQKNGESSLKDSEYFKKHYAAVLIQLNEVNEQVSSALFCLRQRNTYQANSPYMLLKPVAELGDPGLHAQEPGSHVAEIVGSSRTKARTMVDAAMQAVSTMKKGEINSENIEEAIDFVNKRISVDDVAVPAMRSAVADATQVTLASQSEQNMCADNTSATSHVAEPRTNNSSDQSELEIPSDLIAHCVSTLLMIQKCTERQFPPGDVAQVLDSAVNSLQPCCSQNLPIYAEIQKCMGIIRSQILALIPT